MIDFSLTQEQRLLQQTARDFAAAEIAPGSDTVEASAKPYEDSIPIGREILRKGAELGFLSLLVPEAYGGSGGSCIDMVLLCEELATADIAFAGNLFSLTATMTQLIVVGGNDEQKDRFLGPIGAGEPIIFSGALSEPNVAGSDLFYPEPDPSVGVRTVARRQGDRYILNGAKSAFVTNAGVADWYFVMARTDLSRPVGETLSIFAVPANAKGLSIGKHTELLGWRAGHHGQVILDDVEVPIENRIGEEGAAMPIFGACTYMPISLAACFVGLAKAAQDYAVDYAKTRTAWKRPIIEHQAVALKLADMAVQTNLARLAVWDAAYAADHDPFAAATFKSPQAKTVAVDAAIHNAQKCVEVLGGYGVTNEYKAGRYLRDAWVGYACDFTRDLLRLGLVRSL